MTGVPQRLTKPEVPIVNGSNKNKVDKFRVIYSPSIASRGNPDDSVKHLEQLTGRRLIWRKESDGALVIEPIHPNGVTR